MTSACPEIALAPGSNCQGFAVCRATRMPAIRSTVYELEHLASGARILHIHNADRENLFSVTFATPPADSTGLPHILEHAVLGGSRKYPVRDPFFEMVKLSMATFINAMTASDHTLYPVCSNVRKDLFNLADVYFDAVFHPTLTETTFAREGHHLAPADPEQPLGALEIKGIVYSEMQGVFSSPEALLFYLAQRHLFPDTPYGFESGGDPAAIPSLTYAQFLEFWRTHYHPSNAYFVLYGDIPTADHLEFLAPRLADYTRQPPPPPVPSQPRWNEPRSVRDTYSVETDETKLAHKTYLALSWLLGDATDPEFTTDLDIVSRLLVGHDGAPLRKALVDSQLGQDLVHTGDLGIGLETTFSAGLKGSDESKQAEFEALVLKVLRETAEGTFPESEVESAFQQSSYSTLEIDSQYPLKLLDDVIGAWIYGRDPLTYLKDAEHLEAGRRRHAANPRHFNEWIRRHLLDNPHRLSLCLVPEPGKDERAAQALEAQLAERRRALDDRQMQEIAAAAAAIEEESGTGNTQEQLATLPQLQLGDLPRAPVAIPFQKEIVAGGVEMVCPEVFSNGVNYLVLSFDLAGLPERLWPLLPRYADALEKMGTASLDYAAAAARLASVSGGFAASVLLSADAQEPDRPVRQLRIAIKALDGQMERAMEALGDHLFTANPRDRLRLRDVVTQAYTGYRSFAINNGNRIAALMAQRGFLEAAWLGHLVNGLPQLERVGRLKSKFDTEAESLMAAIEELRQWILAPARLTVAFTGSEAARAVAVRHLEGWIGRMPCPPLAEPFPFQPWTTPPAEGFAGPGKVSHCVQAFRAPHFRDPANPLVTLGAHFIGHDWLLPEIRFKGNAYGAGASYSSLDGLLMLSSFRDPQIAKTLKTFAASLDYVRQADWSRADLDRAIIGTAKNSDRPIRPEAATAIVLSRHTQRITEELRQRYYDGLLSATVPAVKAAILEVLEAGLPNSAVCVVSNAQKLAAEAAALPRPLTISPLLAE